MDNLMVTEKAQAITMRDNWLIKKGNPPPDIKAQIKKAVDIKKKLVEKQVKAQKKSKQKTSDHLK